MERDRPSPDFGKESETGRFLHIADKILRVHGEWTGEYSRQTSAVKLHIDQFERNYRLTGRLYGINISSGLKSAVISEDGWTQDGENVEVPSIEVQRDECCFGGCPGIGLGEKSKAFEILEKIETGLESSKKTPQTV